MVSRTPSFLSTEEVLALIPLSRSQIWRLEQAGQFPRRIKIAARRVGWLQSEIEGWILARAADRTVAK